MALLFLNFEKVFISMVKKYFEENEIKIALKNSDQTT